MMKIILFLLIANLCQAEEAVSRNLWKTDVQNLFAKVGPKVQVEIQWPKIPSENLELRDEFQCRGAHSYTLRILSKDPGGALYFMLNQIGFSFPHPRWTITPDEKTLKTHCGEKFDFKPAFAKRGFHIHLQHPSEWVSGFVLDQPQIARDFMLWLVHNSQNVLQIQMIRAEAPYLPVLLQEAKNLGLYVVLNFSLASQQQKSFSMLPLWSAITGVESEIRLHQKVEQLILKFPMSAMNIELGTSELTSTSFERTLEWIELIRKQLQGRQIDLMTKVHVSMGQISSKWGNFNFLAQHSDPRVGVQVHTVMWYGLESPEAPVYGRKNFQDLLQFMKNEVQVRPTWYFPETSYWIGMDLDVPLWITDYLSLRAADLKLCADLKVPGVVNFTTGQELGSWMMDWTHALMSVQSKSNVDPLIGLRKLGEDPIWWSKYLQYQHHFFIEDQLIQFLSAKNLMDEIATWLPLLHPIHARENMTEDKLRLLQKAVDSSPDINHVKNKELRILVEMNELRMKHVLHVQTALLYPGKKQESLNQAQSVREQAQVKMEEIKREFNRYPESFVFEKRNNPTSYAYGYGWPAVDLHFWKREEAQAQSGNRNPFFMNIYDLGQILF